MINYIRWVDCLASPCHRVGEMGGGEGGEGGRPVWGRWALTDGGMPYLRMVPPTRRGLHDLAIH